MITALQAKKLRDCKRVIRRAKYYEHELNYIARRIQHLIKRNIKEEELIYQSLTAWQKDILEEIITDYNKELNYHCELVYSKNNDIYLLRLNLF